MSCGRKEALGTPEPGTNAPEALLAILGLSQVWGAKFTPPLSASGKRALPHDIPHSDSIHLRAQDTGLGHPGPQLRTANSGPGVPRRRGLLQAFGQFGGVGKGPVLNGFIVSVLPVPPRPSWVMGLVIQLGLALSLSFSFKTRGCSWCE